MRSDIIYGSCSVQGGKNYWLEELAGGLTRLEMFNGFLSSSEFQTLAADYGIRVQ